MERLINLISLGFKYSFTVVMGSIIYLNSANALELQVIGNVTKGTCTVSASSLTVIFAKPLQIRDIKSDIADKTYVKPFSLEYTCADFDVAAGAGEYAMNIKVAAGTTVDANNKIYPITNNTNAAFVLSNCDSNKQNCRIFDFNNGGNLPLRISENGKQETNFEVSVIQLGNNTPKPGELVAAIDITLVQP